MNDSKRLAATLLGAFAAPAFALGLARAGVPDRPAAELGRPGLQGLDQSGPDDETLRYEEIGRVEDPNFHGIALRGDRAYLGHEYATLIVLDVSDPAAPREVGRAARRRGGREVALEGGLALVTLDPSGVRIVDVSNAVSQRIVGQLAVGGAGEPIALRDGRAYVADGKHLVILDPDAPDDSSDWSSIETDMFGPRDFDLAGDLVYLPQYWDRLTIVDIGDPEKPVVRGGLAGRDGHYGRGMAVDVRGSLAYLGEEVHGVIFIPTETPLNSVEEPDDPLGDAPDDPLGESPDAPMPVPMHTAPPDGGRLSIVDVSDPDAVVELGRSEPFYAAPVVSVQVVGDQAWLRPERGFAPMVLDVSDPTRPNLLQVRYEPPLRKHLRDLVVDGERLYLVTEEGLLILERRREGEAASPTPSPPNGEEAGRAYLPWSWTVPVGVD